MDRPDKAIYDLLSSDVAVSSTVGTRIYPNASPQDSEYPHIVYRTDDSRPSDTKDGASTVDAFRVLIFCYARTFDECHALAIAVREAIDYVAPAVYSDVDIDGIKFRTHSDSYDEDDDLFFIESEYQARVKV